MSAGPLATVCLAAGGHARVVIESAQRDGSIRLVGIVDPAPALAGQAVYGLPVLGGDEVLGHHSFDAFINGLGGVSSNSARRAAFEKAADYGLEPRTVVDPTAAVSATAQLGPGSFIAPLAAVNAGAKLGVNVIVNTRAVVEHDAAICDHAHIAPGAIVLGGATIGQATLIGSGAVVLPGVTVGPDAVVGAGSVVTRDVRVVQP